MTSVINLCYIQTWLEQWSLCKCISARPRLFFRRDITFPRRWMTLQRPRTRDGYHQLPKTLINPATLSWNLGPSLADLAREVVHWRGCTLEEDACGVEARRFYLIGSLDGLPTTGGVDSRRVSSLIDFESLERPVSIEFPSFNLNLRVGEYVQGSYPRLFYIRKNF